MKGIATGIGSLPYSSYLEAIQTIVQYCPKAPYWPQLPQDFHKGQLICPYASKGPIALMRTDNGWIYRLTREPWTPPQLNGLEVLAWALQTRHEWIKGQITGPLTLGLLLEDENGKPLLDDSEALGFLEESLLETVKLQLKGLFPASKRVLIFFDEPVLGLEKGKQRMADLIPWYDHFLQKAVDFGAVPGIHCCGDFLWKQVLAVHPAVVSFDSYKFAGRFMEMKEMISAYVKAGGFLSFGAVPASPEIRRVTDGELYVKLNVLLESLAAESEVFFITPTCGMGNLDESVAVEILHRTKELAKHFPG